MTTTIAPGDLVLRNGRAEGPVTWTGDFYYSTHPDKGLASDGRAISDATRIGAVSDGWRVNGDGAESETLPTNAVCEVVGADGLRWTDCAGNLAWSDDPIRRIVAYRVVSRGYQSLDERIAAIDARGAEFARQNAERVPLMDGAGQTAQPDRTADLRAVAAEMRRDGECLAHNDTSLQRSHGRQLLRWADRIDPPAPAPLKCGDRVRWEGDNGTVQAVTERGWAWVLYDGDDAPETNLAADLESIP